MVIGFMGFARVGKDTAANAVGWPKFAFADQLRSDLAPLLAKLEVNLEDPKQKALARPLMVEYGRLARTVDPGHWIKQLEFEIAMNRACGVLDFVVSDVRYLDEVRWIQNQGGTVVYVIRPDYGPANGEESASIADILNAERCGEIRPIHPVVNDGDIEQFQGRVRRLVAGFGMEKEAA